jgi:hypothetical protein
MSMSSRENDEGRPEPVAASMSIPKNRQRVRFGRPVTRATTNAALL